MNDEAQSQSIVEPFHNVHATIGIPGSVGLYSYSGM